MRTSLTVNVLHGKIDLLLGGGVYGGTDNIYLTALADQLADKAVQTGAVALIHHKGVHTLTSRGHLVHERYVKVTVQRQGKGSRNGGRAHDQHVRHAVPIGKRRPLIDPEAVLLVGDHKPRGIQLHALAEKRLRAHHHRDPLGGISL